MGGCVPPAQAQNDLKQRFDHAVAFCESTPLTRESVHQQVDCVNDVRERMASGNNYPHMELISQINASNNAAAAAHSDGKISKEQFIAAKLQNKATFEQSETMADSPDRTQRAQALSNFGNMLMNYSAQQQAITNSQNQQLLNSMPRTTNCQQTIQGTRCTTW